MSIVGQNRQKETKLNKSEESRLSKKFITMLETKIQLSKTKIVYAIFGSVIFVMIGLWLFQNLDKFPNYNPLLLQIIFISTVIFFGLCCTYAIIKLFDKKPGLVINDSGIFDNSSAMRAGLIKWENITNVYVSEIFKQQFLTIEVNNTEELLLNQSGLRKLIMRWNKDFFNSPIQISSITLECSLEELYEIIKRHILARR